MSGNDLLDPVISSPNEEPSHYFVIGPGGPTGEVANGRRSSEIFVRHCYFTGDDDPYKKQKIALKAEVDLDTPTAMSS